MYFSKVIIISKIQWPKHPELNHLTEKPEEEELRPSPSISTRSSSKYTLTSVSPRRLWTSWTPSSTISSTELPLKDLNSSDSTKEELSHPEKSNLLLNLSSLENLLDTPSLKEPRLLQNTSNNDFVFLLICIIL